MPHHKTGTEVLLRPRSRAERKIRAGAATASILWRGGMSPALCKPSG